MGGLHCPGPRSWGSCDLCCGIAALTPCSSEVTMECGHPRAGRDVHRHPARASTRGPAGVGTSVKALEDWQVLAIAGLAGRRSKGQMARSPGRGWRRLGRARPRALHPRSTPDPSLAPVPWESAVPGSACLGWLGLRVTAWPGPVLRASSLLCSPSPAGPASPQASAAHGAQPGHGTKVMAG